MGNSIVNGKTANVSIKGAIILLALLIAAITAIVLKGQEIPQIFVSIATLLVGFLAGTRTVSDDVKDTILKQNGKEPEVKK